MEPHTRAVHGAFSRAEDGGAHAHEGVFLSSIDEKSIEGEAADERYHRTQRIARWITVAVLVVIIAVIALVPSLRESVGNVIALLSSGDTDAVVEYIRSFGAAAAVVSSALMILQSLAAPIPAFVITISNAAVFGWWQGAALSWTSSMVGAALCFAIARVLGREAVARFVTQGALAQVDRFFEKFGAHAILICRLLPFISFDYVSYAAGLTGMSFWKFIIATGIGQLPATLVYSYVGGTLTGGAQALMTGLLVAFAAATFGVIVYRVFKSRHTDLVEGDQ